MHECIGFPVPLKPWENSRSSTAEENEAMVPQHSKSSLRVCTHLTRSAQPAQTLQHRTVDSRRLQVTRSKPLLQAEPVRTANPASQSAQSTFTGLTPVCWCLSCTGKPKPGHSSPNAVSQVLNRGAKNHPTCWLSPLSPRWGWSPLQQIHTAGSCSACHPTGLFVQSCFPASQSPADTGAWDYSIPDAGFSTWLC